MNNNFLLNSNNLFDLSQTIAQELFLESNYPWEVLTKIKDFVLKTGPKLDKNEYKEIKDNIWVSKYSEISSTACIESPAIIQKNVQIRHNAYIRGSVIVGENCVVGNSTELKNCILLNNSQVPHFNYVGDSILGYKSHMGAGSIISNLKSDKSKIIIKYNNSKIETNLRKFGALVGDNVEIGCNSVLNPGTIIGKNSTIYPVTMVRGVINSNMIVKKDDLIVQKI